jgi:hypothetical protein
MLNFSKILICAVSFFLLTGQTTGNGDDTKKKPFNADNCTCKDIPLKGKVKVVTSFPDFKVKIVKSFPDLKVKTVTAFPNEYGQWQFVESFPDFTIQYVTSSPDFTIKFVESFPGTK